MVREDDLWPSQQNAGSHLPNLNNTSKIIPPSCMNPSSFCKSSFFPPKLGIKTDVNDASGSIQKRFLIFDQCGNQMRMFYSPIVAPVDPAPSPHLRDKNVTSIVEKISPTKEIIQDKSNENHIIEDGSEMHEDTEEINALLYSDDEEEEEDDEVTSTYRSPFKNHEKYEKEGEIIEGVASSGGPIKRQRVNDGAYKNSLLKLDRSCKYYSDAESSQVNGGIELKKNTGSVLGVKRSRKDKIKETLRILESIIPSSKSKDPLMVIDEAIEHLKSLKLKVKELGLTHL